MYHMVSLLGRGRVGTSLPDSPFTTNKDRRGRRSLHKLSS